MRAELTRLGHSALIYGVGQTLNRFLGFLLLPLFTAYLSPRDYGIIGILAMVTAVATPVFSLGLGSATGVCYFARNDRHHRDTTIWTAFGLLLVSVLVLGILAVGFGDAVTDLAFQASAYTDLVMLSFFSVCLSILALPFMLYLQFEQRARMYVALSLISTIATIGINLAMVVALGRGVRGMIEGGLIAQAIALALFLIPTVPKMRPRFSWTVGRQLLRLGLPLVPAFGFVFTVLHGTRYLLQWFSGLHDVGLYSVGFSAGLVLTFAVNGFTSAWFPYFQSFVDRPEEARRLFGRIMTYYVLGIGGLSLVFYIAAKALIMVMTQPAFHDAYQVVGFAASAQFLTGVFSILLAGAYVAKELHYVTVVQALAAVISVVLGLVLIPPLGLLGAGVTLVLAHLTMAALQYACNRYRGYLEVEYEWRRVGSFAAVNVIIAGVTLWRRELPLAIELALASAALVVLGVTLYLLLSPEERRAVRAIARRLGAAGAVVIRSPAKTHQGS